MVTKITTATTHAQNTQAPMAKHVVIWGHAWSHTSQRRSQMRKTPKLQRPNALWPWVTHGHGGSVTIVPSDAIVDVSKPIEMCWGGACSASTFARGTWVAHLRAEQAAARSEGQGEVGHAWSQTSHRRSQMRKTPKPQWQHALWPWVTHGHKHHNCDHKERRARGSAGDNGAGGATKTIGKTGGPEAFQEELQNGRTLFIPLTVQWRE